MTQLMEAGKGKEEEGHSICDETDWRRNSSEGCRSRTATSPLCEKVKRSFRELSVKTLVVVVVFKKSRGIKCKITK